MKRLVGETTVIRLKTANVQLASSFRMAGKEVAGSGRRCFEGGKTFFSSIVGLAEEKNEHFVPKKSNYVS